MCRQTGGHAERERKMPRCAIIGNLVTKEKHAENIDYTTNDATNQ